MIFSDFRKALNQLGDRRFLSVLLVSLGLTFLLLGAVFGVSVWVLQLFLPESISLPFGYEISHVDTVFSVAALGAMFLASPFLMFPVAALFVGLFLDRIVDAVEAKHYPHLPNADGQGVSGALIDAAKFSVVILLANLVALIIYLLVAPLAPFIFWIVNGYLLGREYFHQVAIRRLGRRDAADLRRANRVEVWGAGILMAIPLSVPVLNLVVPIIGVATFCHMVQRLKETR